MGQMFLHKGRWVSFEQLQKSKELEKEADKILEDAEKNESKKFCEFCDSKGHFHKKDCTRPK